MASVQYLSIDAVALIIRCVRRAVILSKKKMRKAKSICLRLGVHLLLVITRGPAAILLLLGTELDSLEFEGQLPEATDLVSSSFQRLLVKW